jgi:predicted metal-dependent hydrolase
VRLRVTVRGGLEVVIPRGYDEGRIPALLEKKKHWIAEALDRAEAHRKFIEPEPSWRLPTHIKLTAVGMSWHVSAKATDVPWVAVRELGEDRLVVFGAISNEQGCRDALARWLLRQTREHLVPRLDAISRQTKLRYERAFVKRQRTRWASCSRQKTISLNSKLLFLPPELVDYVITHELCHVAEMNHSLRFWALLGRHCARFEKLDEQLRDMWKVVPRWATDYKERRSSGADWHAGHGDLVGHGGV